MYTHSLFDLLRTFGDKEMMKFGKFLKSPYFNNRNTLNRLFEVLRTFHPEYDHKNLTKEKLFEKIYKNNNYNDSTFRNLMSDLQQAALTFLKLESFRKNEVDSSFFLTDELAQRGLAKIFDEKIRQTDRQLGLDKEISSAYFLSKFRTQTDQFYMYLQSVRVLKKSFVESESKKLVN